MILDTQETCGNGIEMYRLDLEIYLEKFERRWNAEPHQRVADHS